MKNDYIKTVAFATIAALALATNAQQAEPCGMKRLGKVKNTEYVISQTDPSSLYLTNFNEVAIQATTTTVSGVLVVGAGISSTNTMLSVGIGTDAQKQNAFEIKTTGDVFIKGIGNYDGINQSSAISLQQKILNLEAASSGGIDADAIDIAASNAVERINSATNFATMRQAMIDFIQSFRKQ